MQQENDCIHVLFQLQTTQDAYPQQCNTQTGSSYNSWIESFLDLRSLSVHRGWEVERHGGRTTRVALYSREVLAKKKMRSFSSKRNNDF